MNNLPRAMFLVDLNRLIGKTMRLLQLSYNYRRAWLKSAVRQLNKAKSNAVRGVMSFGRLFLRFALSDVRRAITC